MRPQADAIISQHAEERICRSLDDQVNQAAPAVRQLMTMQIAQAIHQRDRVPPMVRFSSTPSHVHMVMYRSEATGEEQKIAPPPIEGKIDVSMRLHRLVLQRAISQDNVRRALAPMLHQLLAQGGASTAGAARAGMKVPKYGVAWSNDRDWLVIVGTIPTGRPADPLAVH